MIELTQLKNTWTTSGAREVFALLVCQCVKTHYPDAREIRPNPGDDGVDTFSGNLTGNVQVWQAKYFPDVISDAQKKQIRESFKSACESTNINNMKKWVLCIPIDMSVDERKWWEGWKKRNEKNKKVKIVLWDKTEFIRFYSNPDLKPIFDIALTKNGLSTIEELKQYCKTSYETKIKILESEEKYDNAVFVEKLKLAGVKTNRSARTAYYNFALLKSLIEGGIDESEKESLRTLMEEIYAIWEQHFHEANGEYGREFYTSFIKKLKEDKDEFDRLIRLHFLHIEGIIHHWSDLCKSGWTENYDIIGAMQGDRKKD